MSTLEEINAQMQLDNINAKSRMAHLTPIQVERIASDTLVSTAREAMFNKLVKAAEEGKHGWWNPKVCKFSYLKKLLAREVAKGDDADMVDVMNLAAMIYFRTISNSRG